MSVTAPSLLDALRQALWAWLSGTAAPGGASALPAFNPGRRLGTLTFDLGAGTLHLEAIEGPTDHTLSLHGFEVVPGGGRAIVDWEVDVDINKWTLLARDFRDDRYVAVQLDLDVDDGVRSKPVSETGTVEIFVTGQRTSAVALMTIDGQRTVISFGGLQDGWVIPVLIFLGVAAVAGAFVYSKHKDAEIASQAIKSGTSVTVTTGISATGSGSVAGVGSGAGTVTFGSTVTVNGK